MNIEETKNTVNNQLVENGLKEDYKEPAVRHMLFHLCIAIDIYRHMTTAERFKAGYWYRNNFQNSYSLTGFFKERKKKREKKKSPLHPSYKEDSGVVEKREETTYTTKGEASNFGARQKAFWEACLNYEQEYGRQLLLKFFCYWAEEVKGTGLMLWETKRSWNMKLRLKAWSKKSYQLDDQTAALRLERAKAKATPKQPTIDAAEREEANARLEREIAERKQGAISYEAYLRQKESKNEERK
jgi:hypothetical protein